MRTPPNPAESGPSDEVARQAAQNAVQRYAGQPGNLLPILHAIQDALGHIPRAAVPELARALQLSRAEIHGVISFYPHFTEAPCGRVVLEVCRAEACQSMGGDALAEHAVRRLGCEFQQSSPDGISTLKPVYCLGLCAQSPAIMVNGQPYARMTPAKLDDLLQAEGV